MTNLNFELKMNLTALRDSFAATRYGYADAIATLDQCIRMRDQVGAKDPTGEGLYHIMQMKTMLKRVLEAAGGQGKVDGESDTGMLVLANVFERFTYTAKLFGIEAETDSSRLSATWDGNILTLRAEVTKLATDEDIAKEYGIPVEEIKNLKLTPSQSVQDAVDTITALSAKYNPNGLNTAKDGTAKDGIDIRTQTKVDSAHDVKDFLKKMAAKAAASGPGGGGGGGKPVEDGRKTA